MAPQDGFTLDDLVAFESHADLAAVWGIPVGEVRDGLAAQQTLYVSVVSGALTADQRAEFERWARSHYRLSS